MGWLKDTAKDAYLAYYGYSIARRQNPDYKSENHREACRRLSAEYDALSNAEKDRWVDVVKEVLRCRNLRDLYD